MVIALVYSGSGVNPIARNEHTATVLHGTSYLARRGPLTLVRLERRAALLLWVASLTHFGQTREEGTDGCPRSLPGKGMTL